jgi:hypothetical protein
MRILDETMRELAELEPDDIMRVSQLVGSLRKKRGRPDSTRIAQAIQNARRALRQVKGNLSDDIAALREDRI